MRGNINVVKRVISNPSIERELKISRTSIEEMDKDNSKTLASIQSVGADINVAIENKTEHLKPAVTIPTEEDVSSSLNHKLKITSDANDESSSHASQQQSIDIQETNKITKNSNGHSLDLVNEEEGGHVSDLPRQVSVDTSASNNPKIDASPSDSRTQQPVKPVPKVSDMTSTLPRLMAARSELTQAQRLLLHRNYQHVKGQSTSSEPRSERSSSSQLANQWGWFEDVHEGETDGDDTDNLDTTAHTVNGDISKSIHSVMDSNGKSVEEVRKKKKVPEGSLIAVTAPTYVLEESISSQKLWKHTAGTRPPQPADERAFFEKIWAQNFQRSQVDYKVSTDELTATAFNPFADVDAFDGGSYIGGDKHSEADAMSSIASKADRSVFYGANSTRARTVDELGPYEHKHTLVNKKIKDHETDDELTVVVKGDNVFGTTVSKSFTKPNSQEIVTVSISVASYRVVESRTHGKYAQFLVIFCEGTFRDTIGVWKRYSDFDKISQRVTKGHESCTSAFAGINPLAISEDFHDQDHEILPNAVMSWKLLKKRQRWFRCLDAGYLSLKAFLLERFLHDILFESSTPDILRDFVYVDGENK